MAREIEARRGKRFSDPKVQAQFDKQKWYYGDEKYSSARLSATERRNIELIEAVRAERAAGTHGGKSTTQERGNDAASVREPGQTCPP